MRWERLKKDAEDIATYAKSYESAYNGIQSSVRQQEEITKVLKDIVPKTARIQVKNEIKRQDAARKVDESQKRLYTEVSCHVVCNVGVFLVYF